VKHPSEPKPSSSSGQPTSAAAAALRALENKSPPVSPDGFSSASEEAAATTAMVQETEAVPVALTEQTDTSDASEAPKGATEDKDEGAASEGDVREMQAVEVTAGSTPAAVVCQVEPESTQVSPAQPPPSTVAEEKNHAARVAVVPAAGVADKAAGDKHCEEQAQEGVLVDESGVVPLAAGSPQADPKRASRVEGDAKQEARPDHKEEKSTAGFAARRSEKKKERDGGGGGGVVDSAAATASDKKSLHDDGRLLPKGWQRKYSSTYGTHYYYNKKTKKSSWEFPTEEAKKYASASSSAAETKEAKPTDVAKKDASAAAAADATDGIGDGEGGGGGGGNVNSPQPSAEEKRAANSATKAIRYSPDGRLLPKGWQSKFSSTYGTHYYYNKKTKKSSWEFPTEERKTNTETASS